MQMPAHIFDLAGKHMRHRHFYRCRYVDIYFMLRCRFPYIDHFVADIDRIIDLCSGKALRAVFK